MATPYPWYPRVEFRRGVRPLDAHNNKEPFCYAYSVGAVIDGLITLDPAPLLESAATDARLIVFMRGMIPHFLKFVDAYDNLEGGGCGECPSGLDLVNDAWIQLHHAAEKIGRELDRKA